jgi:hypothetical protein
MFSSYDGWKQQEPEHASQCDCCGKLKHGCVDIVAFGMDTHACPECRGVDDPDDARDDAQDREMNR